MIAAEGLTKHFGPTVAVDDVSFQAEPGRLVGLVGHEGAGKTTTLRMLVGLVTPTAGSSTILGRPFGRLDHQLRRVGVMLGANMPPARVVRDHLRICAALAGLPASRIDEALRIVGLEGEVGLRARQLSRGMRQRLGIAVALLADPEVLILDEPGIGLDPAGMRWLRSLLRNLADGGRTVLVSTHDPDEIDEIADQVLVLDRGRLLTESAPSELTEPKLEVVVRSPGAEVLGEELHREGIVPSTVTSDELRFRDVPVQVVSDKVQASDLPVWEIREEEPSLGEAIVDLTRGGSSNGASLEGDGTLQRADEAPDESADEEAALDTALAELPELAHPHVLAVLAPADGLGRTTLSFLLADVLAACAEASTLAMAMSCDRERISMPAAQDRRTSLRLGDLLADLQEFDESAHISPYVSVARSGAHVLSGPAEPEELRALEPDQLDALLDFAGRFYPLVVVDVGGLSESSLRAVVRRADRVLLLGSPGAVDELDERSEVLAAIEAERDEPATLVFNLVDEGRLRAFAHEGGSGSHVLVPQDRDLSRALDASDFELAAARPITRVALKRLALAAVNGLR